jgi:hypothetical protein
MRVHARRGDPEIEGDLLGGLALRDRAHDLTLTVRQGFGRRAMVEDPARHDIPDGEADRQSRKMPAVHRSGERIRLARA